MPTTKTLKKRRRRSSVAVQCAVRGAPAARLLQRFASAAAQAGAELVLRIVGAGESQRLNARYRKKARPTNVLAFAYDRRRGDVVLCHPVIVREARQQRKTPRAHYAHLVVHGVLHLRGYDHLRARDAARMERAEIRILRRLGFPDPYQ